MSDVMGKSGRTFLGRDRAFRRYWLTESVPGLYVEHDDDTVGECQRDEPTPWEANPMPMDEERAMVKVKEIMEARALNEQSSSSGIIAQLSRTQSFIRIGIFPTNRIFT